MQTAAEPARQYIPQPLVTDGGFTTGPPNLAAPTDLGAHPSKALDSAIYSSTELLQNRGRDHGKLILILIVSDGLNELKINQRSHKDVLDRLLRTNACLYALAVATPTKKHKFAALRDYAPESGGDIFFASKSGAMENLYARITEQARHNYTLPMFPKETTNVPFFTF